MRKVLVANRGEIATRAFRAAYELGLRSVAVYTPEDRESVHRVKADEAYEIGEPGHPVRGYLDPELIADTAKAVGADAVYPGYGFLSENPDLASACVARDLTFVGPPAEVLERVGDKVRARAAAIEAGLPVLRATELLEEGADVVALAEDLGMPVFVKAAHGGGGRGMRLVTELGDLEEAVGAARREAESAFGNSAVYLERAMVRPRHIEVQVLADGHGGLVHLFERDCSVQRRHQKVVEIAPAPNLDPEFRDRICADAVQFAKHVGYVNAGTVEFLVDDTKGEHVFIEMNPRIQVEHTVTEETTDVDLVRTQLLVAEGARLHELNLTQDQIRQRGFALQCRITTEDPSAGFRPDTGTISAYRAPGGAGVRLDEGSAYVGAEISPYFDPLLLKLTTRGVDMQTAIARARRAVEEVRIRGVTTNQAFLGKLLDDPDFRAGDLHTTFIDERPQLTAIAPGGDRATRILRLLSERTVNRPFGRAPAGPDPRTKLPRVPKGDPPAGSKQRLTELGPQGLARWLRSRDALQLTDTTLRDAHQSLFATRMRTHDMEVVAPHIARLGADMFSLEVWGGATFDVALRFLAEDPWERIARLRELIPNVCLQMLLRGRNLLGYEPYPDEAVRAFVFEAVDAGVDIFRIFDALNNVEPMRAAIAATVEAGAVAEGAICYTGDLLDPGERLYTLDHYLAVAEQLVDAGAHILAIKDMAGLLRAPAAVTLVTRLRREFDLPVHLHTHDTAGGQLATYLAAIEAGVDAVDGAAASMAGMTSQPSLASIVAATDHTARATPISLESLLEIEPYWEAVRSTYAPFESGLRAPTGRVYRHQIPGGQLSNLRQQAAGLGLGDRFEEVELAYEKANALLGDIIKVTPTSKVVGDLALFVVSAGIDWDELASNPERFDLPASVIGLLRGDLGTPAGGFPQPFTERALRGAARPTEDGNALTPELRERLAQPGADRRAALSELQFPGPTQERADAYARYGDVSHIPTRAFLYGLPDDGDVSIELGPGVRLILELEAIGEPDDRGMRTVLVRVNGQLRPIDVRDESIEAPTAKVERADPNDASHVAAPLTGVVTLRVQPGDEVEAGQPLAVLEAMKMESTVTAPVGGTVKRVPVPSGTRLEQGDLIAVVAEGEDG
jgi:pyruvate carboxylase